MDKRDNEQTRPPFYTIKVQKKELNLNTRDGNSASGTNEVLTESFIPGRNIPPGPIAGRPIFRSSDPPILPRGVPLPTARRVDFLASAMRITRIENMERNCSETLGAPSGSDESKELVPVGRSSTDQPSQQSDTLDKNDPKEDVEIIEIKTHVPFKGILSIRGDALKHMFLRPVLPMQHSIKMANDSKPESSNQQCGNDGRKNVPTVSGENKSPKVLRTVAPMPENLDGSREIRIPRGFGRLGAALLPKRAYKFHYLSPDELRAHLWEVMYNTNGNSNLKIKPQKICWLCLQVLPRYEENIAEHCRDFHILTDCQSKVACPYCNVYCDLYYGINLHILSQHLQTSKQRLTVSECRAILGQADEDTTPRMLIPVEDTEAKESIENTESREGGESDPRGKAKDSQVTSRGQDPVSPASDNVTDANDLPIVAGASGVPNQNNNNEGLGKNTEQVFRASRGELEWARIITSGQLKRISADAEVPDNKSTVTSETNKPEGTNEACAEDFTSLGKQATEAGSVTPSDEPLNCSLRNSLAEKGQHDIGSNQNHFHEQAHALDHTNNITQAPAHPVFKDNSALNMPENNKLNMEPYGYSGSSKSLFGMRSHVKAAVSMDEVMKSRPIQKGSAQIKSRIQREMQNKIAGSANGQNSILFGSVERVTSRAGGSKNPLLTGILSSKQTEMKNLKISPRKRPRVMVSRPTIVHHMPERPSRFSLPGQQAVIYMEHEKPTKRRKVPAEANGKKPSSFLELHKKP